MARLLSALVAVATLAYPFAVYAALGGVDAHWFAFALAALALGRAAARRETFWIVVAAGAAALGAASGLGGALLPVKLYPVLVNGVLFAVFAASLARPPTVVERIARRLDPALPPAGVAYARAVTRVWCAFFVVNGGAAFVTALWASTAVWTLYNGLIAYALMGALFGAEWLVRQRVKARLAEAHG